MTKNEIIDLARSNIISVTFTKKNGEMRKIDIVSIMLLMMSNCHFPFIAKPMIQTIHSLNENEYRSQLIIHKQYVTEMIIGYLFPSK